MTQAGPETLRPPQEPVVKMAREVRVGEIQKILGEGRTTWLRGELFFLDYPEIDTSLSWEVQDDGRPLRLRSVSIGGNEPMKISEDIAVVLDMDDGMVKFVNPVREKSYGYSVTGITLSTRQKLVSSFDILVESAPVGGRATYEVEAANLATAKLKERGGER